MACKLSSGSIQDYAQAAGWLAAYLDLKAAGLFWKKAAFCAWYNAPKATRRPKTQKRLAKLLNYRSPQVFYKWQKQDWFRELGIDKLRETILLRNLGEVDRATIGAAIYETGSPGVAARRLFYEQLSPPTQRIEHTGRDGEAIDVGVSHSYLSKLSDDDLDQEIERELEAGAAAGGEAAPATGEAAEDDPGGEAAGAADA